MVSCWLATIWHSKGAPGHPQPPQPLSPAEAFCKRTPYPERCFVLGVLFLGRGVRPSSWAPPRTAALFDSPESCNGTELEWLASMCRATLLQPPVTARGYSRAGGASVTALNGMDGVRRRSHHAGSPDDGVGVEPPVFELDAVGIAGHHTCGGHDLNALLDQRATDVISASTHRLARALFTSVKRWHSLCDGRQPDVLGIRHLNPSGSIVLAGVRAARGQRVRASAVRPSRCPGVPIRTGLVRRRP
jgi:hypothetical protein